MRGHSGLSGDLFRLNISVLWREQWDDRSFPQYSSGRSFASPRRFSALHLGIYTYRYSLGMCRITCCQERSAEQWNILKVSCHTFSISGKCRVAVGLCLSWLRRLLCQSKRGHGACSHLVGMVWKLPTTASTPTGQEDAVLKMVRSTGTDLMLLQQCVGGRHQA